MAGVTLIICLLVGGALPLAMGSRLPTLVTSPTTTTSLARDLSPMVLAKRQAKAETPSLLALVASTPTATVQPAMPTLLSMETATSNAMPVTPAATIARSLDLSPTTTPQGPAAGATLYVANTAGQGANLRDGASTQARLIRAWVESTPLIATGRATEAEGWTWLNVRDPLGNIGWTPAQLLSPMPKNTAAAIPTAQVAGTATPSAATPTTPSPQSTPLAKASKTANP
jgi:hypothetical protein